MPVPVSYTHLDVYKRQARHHTAPVPEGQGGAQGGVDGPAPVGDGPDVAGLGEHQGQERVDGQGPGEGDRDGTLAVQFAPLTGEGVAPDQGVPVHPDDHRGRWSPPGQVVSALEAGQVAGGRVRFGRV